MKIGDKVQFLSDIGGGRIAGFQGKDIALVEDEDGFQIPTPISDLVVMSSSDDYSISKSIQKNSGAEEPMAADPDTFNMSVKAKINQMDEDVLEDEDEYDAADREITYKAKVEERKGGNVLNVYYAFVPEDVQNFSKTSFACYLVNDSNYYVHYLYMSVEGGTYTLRGEGELEPNTKMYVESLALEDLNEIDRVRFQLLSFKRDKEFVAKPVCDVQFRIDKVKFYKLHTFRQTDFFETPALMYDVVKNDLPAKQVYVSAEDLQDALMKKKTVEHPSAPRTIVKRGGKNEIIEVDLHIGELLDDTHGMSNREMLNYQLDKFREVMEQYKNKREQRIVFIHGKGDGVLRKALLDEMKRKYSACKTQDASFQEYGFGATMVTIK